VAVIGSILTAIFLTSIVSGVARAENIQLTAAEQDAAVIEVEDYTETLTDEQRDEFWNSLSAGEQTELAKIIDASSTSAMKDTLLVSIIFVALGFLASTFLPDERERAVRPEDVTTVDLDDA
jgi:hypothetical protein